VSSFNPGRDTFPVVCLNARVGIFFPIILIVSQIKIYFPISWWITS
jgi:hypothetical protein